MKRRILSVFVLIAVLVTAVMPDISLFETKAAADGPPQGEFVLQMLYNGTLIDRNFNSFIGSGTGTRNVTLRAGTLTRNPDGTETFTQDSSAVIRYTASDNVQGGYQYVPPADFSVRRNRITGTTPGSTSTQAASTSFANNTGWAGVPLGIHEDVEQRVIVRHNGGVSPGMVIEGNIYGMVYTPGTNIAIPTRANNSSGTISTSNTKTNLDAQGNRDVFTISAVATRGSGDDAEIVRNTRTFLLLDKPCGNSTCAGPGTPAQLAAGTARGAFGGVLPNAAHRACHWANNAADGKEMMVFSIYSDSYYLFDHEDGILMPGIDREEWILAYQRLNASGADGGTFQGPRPGRDGALDNDANQYSQTINNRTRPDYVDFGLMEAYGPTFAANFNRRGRGTAAARQKRYENDGRGNATWGGAEVPAYVEMFEPSTGYRHIAQSAGLRMKGGWSRGTNLYEQRTFEFYARNGYNDFYGGGRKDTFTFPLFNEKHNIDTQDMNEGNLVHKYRRFRLRNGGSDRESAYLRDEMASDLWDQTGYPTPPQDYRPAVVFLNGAYYGMAFIKSPRTPNHWDRMYGARESAIHTIGPSERAREDCYSDSCGRVMTPDTPIGGNRAHANVIGRTPGPLEAAPYWGTRTQQPRSIKEGWPDNTYYGIRPRTCGDGSNRCSGARAEYCQLFWGDPDDMCALRDDDGNIIARYGTSAYPCQNGKGNRCTGCKASCDYEEIIKLVVGQEYRSKDGNGNITTVAAMSSSHSNYDDAVLNPIGLTNSARWEEFKRRVDVDEMLHYYAVNMYAANMDWPGNNQEWWRYWPRHDDREGRGELAGTCPDAPAACKCGDNGNCYSAGLTAEYNPHLDGRWRPIAQDLEMGWGIWTTGNNASASASVAGVNTIDELVSRGGKSGAGNHYGASLAGSFYMRAMLGGAAMGNPSDDDYQPAIPTTAAKAEVETKLANAFSDIMAGALDPVNALATFNRIKWWIDEEHQIAIGAQFNPVTYQYVPTPYRRIAEIARPAIQFGNALRGWPMWDEASQNTLPGSSVADVWNVWPQWSRDARADANDGDNITDMHNTIALFLGKSNITTRTANGFTIREGGRANEAGGMPAHVGTTLGKSWGSRNLVVTASVSGNGDAWMNTRRFGMRQLEYAGVSCSGIASSGIACTTTNCWGSGGGGHTQIMVPDARAAGRTDDPALANTWVRHSSNNGVTGTGQVVGRYWSGSNIPIIANPDPGHRAVWNGATPEKAPCHLNSRAENTAYVNSTCTVTIGFELCPLYKESGNLLISGIKATRTFQRNPTDWVELRNPTGKAISTRGLYLADGGNDFKFQMPSIIIRPDSRWYLPSEDNGTSALDANDFVYYKPGVKPYLKRSRYNFNLVLGERLSLNDARGTRNLQGGTRRAELSRAEIGVMGPGQVQLRGEDGKFRILNTSGNRLQHGRTLPGGVAEPQSVSARPPAQIEPCEHGISPPSACETCNPKMCPKCNKRISPPRECECIETDSWTVNGNDPNVSRIGDGSHVLRLANPDTEGKTTLTITMASPFTSSRRIAVWTDRSAGSVADITYLTEARRTDSNSSSIGSANGWIRMHPRAGTDAGNQPQGGPFTFTIPAGLLNGASYIYVSITTDATTNQNTTPNAYTLNTYHRGGGNNNEFNLLGTITLS